MVASNRISQDEQQAKTDVTKTSEEQIHHMARELRANSDPDFPHSYYVEQARRKLAGKPPAIKKDTVHPNAGTQPPPSVFHSWALPD